jgi:hypothetical protein
MFRWIEARSASKGNSSAMPLTDPSILAYHLTWTTYGTWLSGDIRGWIKKTATAFNRLTQD